MPKKLGKQALAARLQEGWMICEPMHREKVWRVYPPTGHPESHIDFVAVAKMAQTFHHSLVTVEGPSTWCYRLRSPTSDGLGRPRRARGRR